MGRSGWHIKFDEEIEIERQKKHLGTEWNNWYTKKENEKEVLKEKKNEKNKKMEIYTKREYIFRKKDKQLKK